jgi:hypothetical protein
VDTENHNLPLQNSEQKQTGEPIPESVGKLELYLMNCWRLPVDHCNLYKNTVAITDTTVVMGENRTIGK